MYNAIKSNAKNESEARLIAGDKIVDALINGNCQFSGRVIDDVYEVQEMTDHAIFTDTDGEERSVEISFLIPQHDIDTYEDMGDYDYSEYYFYID